MSFSTKNVAMSSLLVTRIYFLCEQKCCESTLYYERLSLEIIAAKSHWQIVSPPTLMGRSGVAHRFDFVAMDGQDSLVFDICEQLSETDVIKTYIKQLDTGASACIICRTKKMTEGASKLAAEYGLKVLRSDNIESAFRATRIHPQSDGRRLAAA